MGHKLIMINNLLHHTLKEAKKFYTESNELEQQLLYKYVDNEQKES